MSVPEQDIIEDWVDIVRTHEAGGDRDAEDLRRLLEQRKDALKLLSIAYDFMPICSPTCAGCPACRAGKLLKETGAMR